MEMKEYEDRKYESWREHTEAILPSLLKRNLLIALGSTPNGKSNHTHHKNKPGGKGEKLPGAIGQSIIYVFFKLIT